MSNSLIDRIDETREAWSGELEVCRNDILDTVRVQHAASRLVVEFDYLLVEAKLAIINTEAERDEYNKAYSDECATNVYLKKENERLGNTIDSQQVWVEKYKQAVNDKDQELFEAQELVAELKADIEKYRLLIIDCPECYQALKSMHAKLTKKEQ